MAGYMLIYQWVCLCTPRSELNQSTHVRSQQGKLGCFKGNPYYVVVASIHHWPYCTNLVCFPWTGFLFASLEKQSRQSIKKNLGLVKAIFEAIVLLPNRSMFYCMFHSVVSCGVVCFSVASPVGQSRPGGRNWFLLRRQADSRTRDADLALGAFLWDSWVSLCDFWVNLGCPKT